MWSMARSDVRYARVVANTIMYGVAINTFRKCGRWQEVMWLLREMQLEGVRTDIVAGSVAIS